MEIIHSVAELPLWLAFVVLVALPTLIAVCGPIIVRRFFPVEALVENNEVAGFKFATLGVVYAVLLGLAVISVWEKFAEAEGAAEREASAIASLYRLADGTEAGSRATLKDAITVYGRAVIEFDWPAMERDEESSQAQVALNNLYTAAIAAPATTPTSAAVLSAILDQLDNLTDARRERLALSEGVVPEVIWVVLFVGAGITIAFTFFFGLRNYGAQLLMTGMLSVTIFLALFVGLLIDKPFAGGVRVPPTAMAMVMQDFSG